MRDSGPASDSMELTRSGESDSHPSVPGPPPDLRPHATIESPAGESINSRVCGAVVEVVCLTALAGVNTGTITHPVDTFGDIDDKISEFLATHRPTMRDLVANAHDVPSLLPSWKPKSKDNELAMHISKLSIPTISRGRPSLLLHGLGEEEDNLDKARIARVPAIFAFHHHTYVT